jgi:hypothetical protein
MNIYRKLSDGPVGSLLGVFGINAFEDLADDAESSSMDYNRKKID